MGAGRLTTSKKLLKTSQNKFGNNCKGDKIQGKG